MGTEVRHCACVLLRLCVSLFECVTVCVCYCVCVLLCLCVCVLVYYCVCLSVYVCHCVYALHCYLSNCPVRTCLVPPLLIHVDQFPSLFPCNKSLTGKIPFSAPLCLDSRNGICYGLSGCPVIKSSSRDSSRVSAFISMFDRISNGDMVAYSVPLRGVSDLCELKEQCYHLDVGGRNDKDGVYELCGSTFTSPSSGSFCVTKNIHNNTLCSSMEIKPLTCDVPNQTPLLFVKYAAEGMGWGLISYKIKAESGVELTHGTLLRAQIGSDMVCLEQGKCYELSFTLDQYIKNAAFVFCG